MTATRPLLDMVVATSTNAGDRRQSIKISSSLRLGDAGVACACLLNLCRHLSSLACGGNRAPFANKLSTQLREKKFAAQNTNTPTRYASCILQRNKPPYGSKKSSFSLVSSSQILISFKTQVRLSSCDLFLGASCKTSQLRESAASESKKYACAATQL